MNDEYELLIYPEEAKNFSTDCVHMIQVRKIFPFVRGSNPPLSLYSFLLMVKHGNYIVESVETFKFKK
jgi:hypothetical protein